MRKNLLVRFSVTLGVAALTLLISSVLLVHKARSDNSPNDAASAMAVQLVN